MRKEKKGKKKEQRRVPRFFLSQLRRRIYRTELTSLETWLTRHGARYFEIRA